jgi:hypothetical protein
MYSGTSAALNVEGQLIGASIAGDVMKDSIEIQGGVLQGSPISPLLFNLFLDSVVRSVHDDYDADSGINSCTLKRWRFASRKKRPVIASPRPTSRMPFLTRLPIRCLPSPSTSDRLIGRVRAAAAAPPQPPQPPHQDHRRSPPPVSEPPPPSPAPQLRRSASALNHAPAAPDAERSRVRALPPQIFICRLRAPRCLSQSCSAPSSHLCVSLLLLSETQSQPRLDKDPPAYNGAPSNTFVYRYRAVVTRLARRSRTANTLARRSLL